MTAEESIASMTDEQIAESLTITPKCLAAYEDTTLFPDDLAALSNGAAIIRSQSTRGYDPSQPIQRPGKLADMLAAIPAWSKRVLVYRRAVSIIEQLPSA